MMASFHERDKQRLIIVLDRDGELLRRLLAWTSQTTTTRSCTGRRILGGGNGSPRSCPTQRNGLLQRKSREGA